jgi:aryl-alcohol dehydrogenase-like predicted oxidoreductase
VVDNGLDEALHRSGVGLLAYSAPGLWQLTGKYDDRGIDPGRPETGRLARFEHAHSAGRGPRRWPPARIQRAGARARPDPTQMALAFCYGSWRVASTIIGVTTVAQLDECLWRPGAPRLSPELLAAIDAIRWRVRDPAQ